MPDKDGPVSTRDNGMLGLVQDRAVWRGKISPVLHPMVGICHREL